MNIWGLTVAAGVAHPLEWVVVAVVGGVAALERRALFQGMLSQPAVLGLIYGTLMGAPALGAALGFVLQLLWIGGVSIGATLPPHETFAANLILPVTLHLVSAGTVNDPTLAFGLAFGVLAVTVQIGRGLERRVERSAEVADRMAFDAFRAGQAADPWIYHARPMRVLLASFTAMSALLFPVGLAAATVLADRLPPPVLQGLRLFGRGLPALALLFALKSLTRPGALRAVTFSILGALVALAALLGESLEPAAWMAQFDWPLGTAPKTGSGGLAR
jgi:mannose/fructose/N-acetylgalactosamine-specific phosphotransferase system component IIC